MYRHYDDGTLNDFMIVVGGFELLLSIETFFPANHVYYIGTR